MRYSRLNLCLVISLDFRTYIKWNRTTVRYKLCLVLFRTDKVDSKCDSFRIVFYPSNYPLISASSSNFRGSRNQRVRFPRIDMMNRRLTIAPFQKKLKGKRLRGKNFPSFWTRLTLQNHTISSFAHSSPFYSAVYPLNSPKFIIPTLRTVFSVSLFYNPCLFFSSVWLW